MTENEEQPDILRCIQCDRPFAVLRAGVLHIQSVHGGEKHWNALSLEQVRQLLGEIEPQQNKRHRR